MRTLGLWDNVYPLRDVVRALIMESRCWIPPIVRGGHLVMHGCRIIIMIIWGWMHGVLRGLGLRRERDIILGIKVCFILVSGLINVNLKTLD